MYMEHCLSAHRAYAYLVSNPNHTATSRAGPGGGRDEERGREGEGRQPAVTRPVAPSAPEASPANESPVTLAVPLPRPPPHLYRRTSAAASRRRRDDDEVDRMWGPGRRVQPPGHEFEVTGDGFLKGPDLFGPLHG